MPTNPEATAHDEINASLKAHPEAIQILIAATQRRIDALPQEARHGAVLFLVSSLVGMYAADPRRAVTELNAHALDAVHHALMAHSPI